VKMRILFVCRKFDQIAGGVERMAIGLMNNMVDRGHEVSLFTWDQPDASPFYPLSSSVLWYKLALGNPDRRAGVSLRARRARRFREFARSRQPAVVIGFQDGVAYFAAVSLIGTSTPVIYAERNAPDRFAHVRAGRYRWWSYQKMRLAAAITVQSARYVERYPSYLQNRITVIPNPVSPPGGYATPNGDRHEQTLLSIGRLSYQKNYPVLLNAFSRLAGDFPRWQLRIVGEGEERQSLETLVGDLGLLERVSMPGATTDVSAEYREADLFCLPSRWEGFPNTLAEAMAHGLPAVGFKGCAGVGELIESGQNGFLSEGNGDVETLTADLRRMMADAQLRVTLGQEARMIAQKFKPTRIFDEWETLFQNVAAS